jgi:urease accessory protein
VIDLISDRDLQRSQGSGRLVISGSDRGTRVVDVYERSPIRIMFPKLDNVNEEAVFINTSGGVAGGDRLCYDVEARPDASIVLTTQAAEKVYRALDEPAHISTKLAVHDRAKLAWLPHETIVFNSARLHRTVDVQVYGGGKLVALEWLVLGRAAHGERVTAGSITDSWHVKKNGRLVWADSFRLTDDTFPHLCKRALLADCTAIGTLVYCGAGVDARMERLRKVATSMRCHCAVTVVAGLLIARFAAKDPSDLRTDLRAFLQEAFLVPKMWFR